MEKNEIVFYYLMFSAGFLFGRITLFGREIIGAVIDLMTMTMQFVVLLFLAYVVAISLDRAKKKFFTK